MNAMHFIIVRGYTDVSLAEAKGYLDHVHAVESIEIYPYQHGQSVALAEKILPFGVVKRAEVIHAEPCAAPDRGGRKRLLIQRRSAAAAGELKPLGPPPL
jgi:hypothetical protein